MKISSQRYIDDDIVEQKIAAEDYVVTIATVEHDGQVYEVVVDGHHSLEAARRTGNSPIWVDADYNHQTEIDCIGFDNWLNQHQNDSDWYDIETGHNVW